MPYLGRSPGSGVRTRFIYAATAGQTSFSGNDSNSVSLAYEDTLYMDVYQNGVLLKPVTDYAATTGTSVVLVTGATTDDVVEMIVYDTFAVADTVSAKDGGTFSGNVAMGGTLDVTGAITSSAGATITTADNNAQLILKSTDADASVGPLLQLHRDSASPADDDAMGTIDFRGENSASEVINYVRINTRSADVTDGTEDAKFDVNTLVGGASVNRFSMTPTETVFNEDSVDVDFRVESNGNANMLTVNAGEDKVGIGRDPGTGVVDIQCGNTTALQAIRIADTSPTEYFGVFNANEGGNAPNAANATLKVRGMNTTNRAINAGGTVNASGADYAEYMIKADGVGTIAKGAVCGVDANGKLTDIFANAHSFVIKSTDPSYVGGDVWSIASTDADGNQTTLEGDALEAARQKVDRIAFSGQVPCTISGTTEVGDFVIAQAKSDGGIEAVAVTSPTFEQYCVAIGKVWKLGSSQHTVAVKIG